MQVPFPWTRIAGPVVLLLSMAGSAYSDSFAVSVHVDVSQSQGELKPIWRFFGADEPNYAYMPNGKKLLGTLGELAPERVFIRTHNLLTTGDGTPALKWGSTNAYREDANGNPIYDWTILDKIFDAYLAAGARPYAQIGFMPKDLSTNPEPYQHQWSPGARYDEIYTGWSYPPKDYERWEALVFEWVKHCVDRYGSQAVETWYWQTWNEADIGYWQGRPRSESFHRLHDHAMAAVRRALPRAKVGGPDSAHDGRFLREFLDHCLYGRNFASGETGTPLDFISFHAKGGPSFQDGHVRMGIAQQLRGINNSFEIIASYPQLKDKPIVIGESDPDGCAACEATEYPQYGYRNGAHYASYTAASFARKHDLAVRHGLNLEGALTWAFTFEDQPYFAGFRSLATNGIDKPVLNVFRMFSKMRGRRVTVRSDHEVPLDDILRQGVRGRPDVSALASFDGERVGVLLWHYHDDGKTGDDAAVELLISGLPASTEELRLTHYRIDETHSNAFTLWKQMGEPQRPTADQYQRLERAGQLSHLDGPDRLAIHDGQAALRFSLPRQGVSLVVLELGASAESPQRPNVARDVRRQLKSDPPGDNGSRTPSGQQSASEPEQVVENEAEELQPSDDAPRADEGSLDLASIEPRRDPIGRIAARYRADLSSLERFYFVKETPNTRARMRKFYFNWLTALAKLPKESLTDDDRDALAKLKEEIISGLVEMELNGWADAEAEPFVPFAKTILSLAENRQHVRKVQPQDAAAEVSRVTQQIDHLLRSLQDGSLADAAESSSAVRQHAADLVERLRGHLERWYEFYNGYDPDFTWWMRAPFKEADTKLQEYAVALKGGDDRGDENASQISRGKSVVVDAREREVPDLVALMDGEPTRMQLVIERFQREIRRAGGRRDSSERSRGDRRDRNEARASQGDRPDDEELDEKSAAHERNDGENSDEGDGEKGNSEERQEEARARRAAAARARREQVLRKWQSATGNLSFDDLSPCDRVDYLLLQNHIEYQLQRLQRDSANADRGRPQPVDESGISGRPIGREALLMELKHEMIAYEPEELIEIAEKEYAWCQAELRKASQEMGLGDDWRAAIEKVKSMHVAPGEQPFLIHSLAWEAIDYLKKHELVTVPPIAAETWRMQMMSPERQLVNPFFTGGSTISVSFPTDSMAHEAKLQSMRGNNIPFARATVHHELIPGHNLQSFMNTRYSAHRRPFATPFWGEGWALYWEMLLYQRGFPTTPEDRVGFLVWRQHRCARIIFSLSYHLERMKPVECIDFLVDKVGFDRNNATAEVRRSVENAQPLYQAAYMLGGLQFQALRRELVESGKMTNREFHDAILQEGSMPVVMVRALIAEQTLPRAEAPRWRFYETDTTE